MAWKKLSTWYTRLRDDSGKSRKVSLGTSHKKTAERMEGMFASLREQGDGWAVNALVAGTIKPLRVFNAVAEGRSGLDALKLEIQDHDLSQYAPAWERWALRHAGTESVKRYAMQVQVLFSVVGMTSKSLTRKHISEALLGMDVKDATARHYHAAWSSFFNYLVEIGAVEQNPMRSIKAPSAGEPKDLWLHLSDVIRLVTAQDEPFRSLAAFREGAGVEVSAALRVRRIDVNLKDRTIRARGTKTHSRDRLVRVDEWAWEYVKKASESLMPDALLWPLFDGQDKDVEALKKASAAVYRSHKRARNALPTIPDKYTVHDARHSYAVRHVKAGDPYTRIANNLGHTNVSQVIRNYGKYRLSDEEVSNQLPKEEQA